MSEDDFITRSYLGGLKTLIKHSKNLRWDVPAALPTMHPLISLLFGVIQVIRALKISPSIHLNLLIWNYKKENVIFWFLVISYEFICFPLIPYEFIWFLMLYSYFSWTFMNFYVFFRFLMISRRFLMISYEFVWFHSGITERLHGIIKKP